MRRLTAPERAFISGDKIGKDWFSLKETIPEQYKEDFDDNLLFELVRPWPFQLENENQFRDVFRGQGGTMDYRFLQESLENYIFFEKILKFEYEPKLILETGTNACIFDWFCYKFLDDFELHTVDINTNCDFFVEEVNRHFGKNNITFHNASSPESLSKLFSGKKFDLAFLDAGHTRDQLLGEMNAADDLKIPVLIVDDWANDELNGAITDFVNQSGYEIVHSKKPSTGTRKVGWVKILENNQYGRK